MGSPLIQNVDSQTQNSQPVDLSDSDLLLYRDPNLYFHNLADKAFAFVTSQHLFVLNLIVSKLQIIDFTPTEPGLQKNLHSLTCQIQQKFFQSL